MAFTMQDFMREFANEHFAEIREVMHSLPPEKRQKVLAGMSPDDRLAGMSPEEIQQYLDKVTSKGSPAPRKPRRKK